MSDATRHPISQVLEACREALVDPAAPTAVHSKYAFVFDGLAWAIDVPAQPPFYVLMAAAAEAEADTRDDAVARWRVQIWAVQEDLAAAPGGALLGTPPHSPPARAGLLDLVWAVKRTLHGRGFAGYGRLDWRGETETREVLDIDGEAVRHLVARAVLFDIRVAVAMDPIAQ